MSAWGKGMLGRYQADEVRALTRVAEVNPTLCLRARSFLEG